MKSVLPRNIALLSALLLLCSLCACAGQPPKSGLIDGHLRPCPDTPNCLNSENYDTAYIAPLAFTSSTAQAWQNLKQTIADTDGVIVENETGYLRAVYTSQVMRFADDLEFRLDEAAGKIQVRAASRTGFWDLGVNRRRVEWIRRLFAGREARAAR